MRQEFPDLRRHYYRVNRLWPGSCFAGPAGGGDGHLCRYFRHVASGEKAAQGVSRDRAEILVLAGTGDGCYSVHQLSGPDADDIRAASV